MKAVGGNLTRNVTISGKLQMFICFNFFISPVSLSKTWSLLHPRTEVPEDRHGMEVALGQWHRAVLRQWAALMVSDCRKDQLQGQQANPTRFSLPLWIKGLGWKEKTPAGGGGCHALLGSCPALGPSVGAPVPSGQEQGLPPSSSLSQSSAVRVARNIPRCSVPPTFCSTGESNLS